MVESLSNNADKSDVDAEVEDHRTGETHTTAQPPQQHDHSGDSISPDGLRGADLANAAADTVPVAQGDGTLAMSVVGSDVVSETFTSSGTWTKPEGALYVSVVAVGGGGGGGSIEYGGAGSGAEGVFETFDPSELPDSIDYTVGAGGGGGGGDTTFGPVTAKGGGRGDGGGVTGGDGVSGGTTGGNGEDAHFGGGGSGGDQNNGSGGGDGGNSVYGGGGGAGGDSSDGPGGTAGLSKLSGDGGGLGEDGGFPGGGGGSDGSVGGDGKLEVITILA